MGRNLVIVESPSKSKTIEKYLGSNYKVVSSKGHIRDLSTKGKFGLGIDIENNFSPDYITIKGKSSVVSSLVKDVKGADKVYLASDPDREGEAIAWHLFEALKIKDNNYERVVFNEITKNAVSEAFKNSRKIDMDMVNSQETRRMLDRIIGFRLSKLMQAKTDGKSAGRVQSVALKLIVDKEREIEKFVPEEYHTITAIFPDFKAELFNYNNKDIKINNFDEANKILKELSNNFKIESVEEKEKNRKSKAPFITSTLQQEAYNKLGFNSKKTMSIAQKLYEGIELSDGLNGLISYMRTDSIRLSNDFVKATYKYIENTYGEKYTGSIKVSKKVENVQDAHEAIRPVNILNTPEKVKPYLTNDEFKLYRIIYYRTLASLMSDAKFNATSVILDNNNYQFKANGSVITFDGYLKVYKDYEDAKDVILPPFDTYKSKILISTEIINEQHFTKAPARYNESKLIKEMEELGIGRPSTYAKTIDNLKTRSYIEIVDKRFIPTEVGIEVTDKLQEHFSHIINVEYTANMENELDLIADNKLIWTDVLKEFYSNFEESFKEAYDNLEKKELKYTGENCPLCNSPLVLRKGKFGEFSACSAFPKCKYIKNDNPVVEIIKCPKCKEGSIVEKKSKRGKIFYGCNNYPKCKNAYWDKPIEEQCKTCGENLVQAKDKIKCPKCTD